LKADYHTGFNTQSAHDTESTYESYRRQLTSVQSPDTIAKLAAAKTATLKVANLIHQRFEFSSPRFQFLLVSANVPRAAWDILMYKTAKKFVDGNSTFKFIFGGSSVTAGKQTCI
jgi:hypothetical protein